MNSIGRLTLAALFVPTLLEAQALRAEPAAANPVMNSFKFMTARFGGWLQTAFDSIPADRYAYRPTPVQQSIGHIAQHLEDANHGLCDRFGAMKYARGAKDALPDTVKATWLKDTLVARLKASFAFCDAAMAQLTDATLGDRVPFGPPGAGLSALPPRSLLLFVTDLAEHYSQVSNYMRLIGLVPPSALPPRQRAAIDVPASVLSQYVGTYDLPASAYLDLPALVLEVTMKNGALYLKPGARPAAQLWAETAADFFVREVDAQVTFRKDARGAVTGLVLHQYGESRAASKVR